MHRLIKEYLREVGGTEFRIKSFDVKFCKYFNDYLVEYAIQVNYQNVTESLEHEFKADHQNIHHYLEKLLSRTDSNYSSSEVQALAFALSTNLISKADVQNMYNIMVRYISSVCDVLNERLSLIHI